MIFTNEVINFFQEKIPEDWINTYKFSTSEEASVSLTNIVELIPHCSITICDYINYSILQGEYITAIETLNDLDKLILLLKESGNINIDAPGASSEDLEKAQGSLFLQYTEFFIKPILSCLYRYKSLCHFVKRRYESHNSDPILFESFQDEKPQTHLINSIDPDILRKTKIVNYNLELARIDHSITVDERSLSRCLFIAADTQKSIQNQAYYNILIEKANFLIYKIIYRFEQDEKNYLYAFDFLDKQIDKSELQVGIFSKYKKITEYHYDDNKIRSSFYSNRVKQFYLKVEKGRDPDFNDYHSVIKYYKDDKHSLEQLENLTSKYEDFYRGFVKNEVLSYNLKAASITRQYILNNLLSLKIQKGEINLLNWETEFKNFKTLSITNNIFNYFPYYKLSLYLGTEIERMFSIDGTTEKEIETLIIHFESTIKELYKAFEWCKENTFVAFQLPLNECLLEDDRYGFKLKIFLSSTFVLPLNYQKIKNEIEEIRDQILRYKTVLSIHKDITQQKSEIKDVKDHIDKSDKKSIEILSIFSAIVLFVLGDIQIFAKAKTINEAFQFMVLFAYVLCLFILLIWFISRPQGYKWRTVSYFQWIILGIYCFGTLGAAAMLNNWPPFQSSYRDEKIEIMQNKMDSTISLVDSLTKTLKKL